MTIVFKPNENVKELVIKYYDKYPQTHPDYTVFQVKLVDCVVTLYESGKLMFQGAGADIEASIWMEYEKKLNNNVIEISEDKKKEKNKDKKDKNPIYYKSTVGSDEVGTGDYFGPIVVTASYVSKDKIDYLTKLGVRDSKKMTDEKIINIAPEIMKNIPYVTYTFDPKSYNSLSKEDLNMNKIKAILHNKVLISLLEKDNYNYDMIVIDQFVYKEKFYEHIKNAPKKINNVHFMTKAEDQVMSVAVSSIISRYIFLKEMKKMSEELGMDIPFSSGVTTDRVAKELLDKIGPEKMKNYVKWNFKNTKKIMD